MSRWRRIISHLGCKVKECIHNSNSVCNSCEPPRIVLFGDGSYNCESKKEKDYTLILTRKETDYLLDLLEKRRMKLAEYGWSYDKGEAEAICDLHKRLSEALPWWGR